MNRLDKQTSPYLLQHADNPVHWHPWDDEALALARKEKKPILLSIGYSSCHWCHVMAHESFENKAIAKLMNDNYINIKVDREERPDLDRIYQLAHQMLNRKSGGWPLTMFLDPEDHLPFFGGTYFPPQPSGQNPGFKDILKGIADGFGSNKKQMEEFKERFQAAISDALSGGEPGSLDVQMVDRACAQIDSSFDEKRGGFSEAPKFPHPAGLELLADAISNDDQKQSERAQHMLDLTLAGIAHGGVFDHLGGGFFRYSTDGDWTIPHFEKMLYDNGPLLSLYAQRAAQTGSGWFRAVAVQTADWMIRDMQLDAGGFCSSVDADSDGGEGSFYIWEKAEIADVLGDDFDAFGAMYGLEKKANFEKRWHLRLAAPDAANPVLAEDPAVTMESARQRLLEVRNTRPAPSRDDKVIVSWNALAIRGLADAAINLGVADYAQAAQRAVDYIREVHWKDGRLLCTSRNGEARHRAYLDDYAYLIDALLTLLAAEWRDEDLTFAISLADALLEWFEDDKRGGFYFTAHDHEKLLERPRAFSDDSMPSGNGVAARALLELGFLVGDSRYTDAGERTLKAGITTAERWPSAHSVLMRGLLDHSAPPPRVILRGSSSDAQTYLDAAVKALSARRRCYVIPPESQELPGLLKERKAEPGSAVTAYFCSGHECSLPATSSESFEQTLGA